MTALSALLGASAAFFSPLAACCSTCPSWDERRLLHTFMKNTKMHYTSGWNQTARCLSQCQAFVNSKGMQERFLALPRWPAVGPLIVGSGQHSPCFSSLSSHHTPNTQRLAAGGGLPWQHASSSFRTSLCVPCSDRPSLVFLQQNCDKPRWRAPVSKRSASNCNFRHRDDEPRSAHHPALPVCSPRRISASPGCGRISCCYLQACSLQPG